MPATRSISQTHNMIGGTVKISITDLELGSAVAYTDEPISFTVVVENNTDLDTAEDCVVRWTVAIGSGRPEPFVKGHEKLTIPAGEQKEIQVETDPLMIEGHAIIAVGNLRIRPHRGKDDEFELKASQAAKSVYEPLASFTVWDRDHYDVVHEQPQRTQRLATLLSILVVALATLQVFSALGWPIVGVFAAVLVAGGVVKLSNTYGVPELIKSDRL